MNITEFEFDKLNITEFEFDEFKFDSEYNQVEYNWIRVW